MPGLPKWCRSTIRGVAIVEGHMHGAGYEMDGTAIRIRRHPSQLLNCIFKRNLVAPTPEVLPDDQKNQLVFTKASYSDKTHVYWKAGSSGVTKLDNKISDVSSPYDHTGLSNGTVYYYRLVAEDIDGESDLGVEMSGTPNVSSSTTDKQMRHGTWFGSGIKKRMTW